MFSPQNEASKHISHVLQQVLACLQVRKEKAGVPAVVPGPMLRSMSQNVSEEAGEGEKLLNSCL